MFPDRIRSLLPAGFRSDSATMIMYNSEMPPNRENPEGLLLTGVPSFQMEGHKVVVVESEGDGRFGLRLFGHGL